ncbi:MAG: AMP-binding protein, partial [Pseudomonadota bacterium]
ALVGAWAAAAPERAAVLHLGADDRAETWSYGRLETAARRLANALEGLGLKPGDRCGVLLPQSPETVITHLALYKLGAVALPLFTLFGEDALAARLADAGAAAVVTDAANWPKLATIGARAPAIGLALCVDGPAAGDGWGPDARGFWETLARASDQRAPRIGLAEEPAFLCYTSGTTGPPKGALHAQRVLIGHLPGVQMWLEGFPRPGDVAWTPADWAWMGGLTNVLMPCLHYGTPVIAHRMAKFDPDKAYWIWRRFGVTVGFMPPTALKMMRAAEGGGEPGRAEGLRLRAIGSGGEPLGADLLDWGRARLGLTINEFYGQTECNLVCGNSGRIAPVKPGSTGPATPGFEVAAIDAAGRPLPAGETGEIAVRRGAPSLFLGYWENPDATAAKFAGDWMRTGDEGAVDADGYVFFNARIDDVIGSAGYRIGPGEVEACLARHPAVAMAGVVGAPDPIRGEKVVAFVTLRDGGAGDAALADALKAHVKARMSPHAHPREIRFIEAMPLTSTGKIMRRALRARFAEDG